MALAVPAAGAVTTATVTTTTATTTTATTTEPAAPTSTVVEPVDDPNGCAARVWDPAGVLADPTRLDGPLDALEGAGYDVHVRVEPLVDGSVDDRQRQLEQAPAGPRAEGAGTGCWC